MTPGSIARRYARALYELAAAEGNVEATGETLGEIAQAVAGAGEARLGAGLLDRETRRKLGRAMAVPVGETSTLGKFLQVVALRDRISALPRVHEFFVKLQDEAAGRVRMSITTASALAPEERDAILGAFRRLAGGEVIAEADVDAGLIAGAVVELGGRVYDGSVRTRLARLAAQMAGESS